jgi:hypothetical protein
MAIACYHDVLYFKFIAYSVTVVSYDCSVYIIGINQPTHTLVTSYYWLCWQM